MKLTRTQLGQLLGYAILPFIWGAIAYAVVSFTLWDLNMALWPAEARVVFAIIFLICVVIHLIRTKIQVVPDEE